MPKRIDFTDEWGHSGISVVWTPTAMRLDMHGWYDQFVGIQGRSMSLTDFFKELGITEAHIKKAFKNLDVKTKTGKG